MHILGEEGDGTQSRDRAWKQIELNCKRFQRSIARESWYYYSLLIVTVVGTAIPGSILLITTDPPDWLRYVGAGLAAIGLLAALVDAKIGTVQRYKVTRTTRSKVELLANKYAGGDVSPKEAMAELSRILAEHEKARSEAIK